MLFLSFLSPEESVRSRENKGERDGYATTVGLGKTPSLDLTTDTRRHGAISSRVLRHVHAADTTTLQNRKPNLDLTLKLWVPLKLTLVAASDRARSTTHNPGD